MKDKFKRARAAAVPLLAIETADPASTIRQCITALNGSEKTVVIIAWDIVQNWKGLNKPGRDFMKKDDWYDPMAMAFPEVLFKLSERAERGMLVFIHNAQRILDRDGVSQGLWIMRDTFKAKGAMVVLLGPTVPVPAELNQDVVVIEDPLPDREQLDKIVTDTVGAARERGAAIPEDFPRAVVLDTLLGLSSFSAEQSLALSINKEGLSLDTLWEKKRRTIEQTPGLKVWRDTTEQWDNLGGLSNLKDYLQAILTSGTQRVRCIGFIDEIEKALAGAAGDLTGVSQDQLQVLLTAMQDENIPGITLIGPPGTGKSAIAKAAGGMSKAEVIAIDLGAMTGSLVGESQRKIRQAVSVFKTVSQGAGLFIATCNKIASLPPELRRRFSLGTFYVDLPTAEERKVIWPVWLKAYGIKDRELPEDEGWTGAEIKACCDIAARTGKPLKESACYIVPVCRSSAKQIDELRSMANGRFISASSQGVYRKGDEAESEFKTVREFNL